MNTHRDTNVLSVLLNIKSYYKYYITDTLRLSVFLRWCAFGLGISHADRVAGCPRGRGGTGGEVGRPRTS